MEELDFLRCFAILAVLAIHVSSNFSNLHTVNFLVAANVMVDEFSHYAVPLFILISGLVLSLKYWEQYDIWSFYKKRLASVVPQYLVFSLAYILLFSILEKSPVSLFNVIYDVLTANGAFHLWFFAVIIEFYLAYPLIVAAYRYFEQRRQAELFLALCLAIQLSWLGFRLFTETILRGSPYYFTFDNLSNRIFLSLLFYFVLGMYITRNLDRVKVTLPYVNTRMVLAVSFALVLVTSIVWIFGIYAYGGYYKFPPYIFTVDTLVEPLLYALLFILLYQLAVYTMGFDNIISRAASSLGKYSFGVYLIHVCYLEIMIIVLGLFGLTYHDWPFYPLLFLSVLILSYVSIYFISYLPWSKYIVGTHNKIKDPRKTNE